MKLGKIVFFAVVLGLSVPAALADTYGEFFGAGSGIISDTGLTFVGQTGVSGGGNTRPIGNVGNILEGTGIYAQYTNGQSYFYHFVSPFIFSFASVSVATPVEFFEVTENGVTLKVYLTEIDDVTLGTNSTGTGANKVRGVIGNFEGEGFSTLSNVFVPGTTDLAITAIDLQLANSGSGAGLKPFSIDITAPTPEPTGLALLGTGILGIAGVTFRKFRSGQKV